MDRSRASCGCSWTSCGCRQWPVSRSSPDPTPADSEFTVIDALLLALVLVVIVDGAGEETGEREGLRDHTRSHVDLLLLGIT